MGGLSGSYPEPERPGGRSSRSTRPFTTSATGAAVSNALASLPTAGPISIRPAVVTRELSSIVVARNAMPELRVAATLTGESMLTTEPGVRRLTSRAFVMSWPAKTVADTGAPVPVATAYRAETSSTRPMLDDVTNCRPRKPPSAPVASPPVIALVIVMSAKSGLLSVPVVLPLNVSLFDTLSAMDTLNGTPSTRSVPEKVDGMIGPRPGPAAFSRGSWNCCGALGRSDDSLNVVRVKLELNRVHTQASRTGTCVNCGTLQRMEIDGFAVVVEMLTFVGYRAPTAAGVVTPTPESSRNCKPLPPFVKRHDSVRPSGCVNENWPSNVLELETPPSWL